MWGLFVYGGKLKDKIFICMFMYVFVYFDVFDIVMDKGDFFLFYCR